jgi:hypothetical protein
MLQKAQLTVSQFLSNPSNVRAVLVIGTLLIAAIAGGAPHDGNG